MEWEGKGSNVIKLRTIDTLKALICSVPRSRAELILMTLAKEEVKCPF